MTGTLVTSYSSSLGALFLFWYRSVRVLHCGDTLGTNCRSPWTHLQGSRSHRCSDVVWGESQEPSGRGPLGWWRGLTRAPSVCSHSRCDTRPRSQTTRAAIRLRAVGVSHRLGTPPASSFEPSSVSTAHRSGPTIMTSGRPFVPVRLGIKVDAERFAQHGSSP